MKSTLRMRNYCKLQFVMKNGNRPIFYLKNEAKKNKKKQFNVTHFKRYCLTENKFAGIKTIQLNEDQNNKIK